MDGYELNAFRFLAKPVEQDRLYRALTDLEAETQDQKRILVTKDGRELFLPIGDILYIKSENIYLSLVTANESHLIRKKLKEILPLLPSSMFCQIHRSYVVNLQKIISYTGKAVLSTVWPEEPPGKPRRRDYDYIENFQQCSGAYTAYFNSLPLCPIHLSGKRVFFLKKAAAFLGYHNFRILFLWNIGKSLRYYGRLSLADCNFPVLCLYIPYQGNQTHPGHLSVISHTWICFFHIFISCSYPAPYRTL